MKTNNEIIAKYFSGLLSKEEVIQFEERLKTDSALKNDIEKFLSLKKIDINNVEFDERYFANLIPKTREKLESRAKSKLHKLAVGVPSLAITIVLVFVLTKSNMNNEKNSLSHEIINNLNDTQIVQQYFTDIDDATKETYYNILVNEKPSVEFVDEKEKEKILAVYDSFLDDQLDENSLSQNELNNIISKIDFKNSK